MRQLADRDRIGRFMAALGRDAPSEARVYLTGGATAVLIGWRDSTIDVDIKLVPDDGSIMRAIPALKESLQINVEFASPADFLPVLDGWPDRSPYIERHGRLSFHHFEFVAQALSKLERSHAQDIADVEEMLRRGLVDRAGLTAYLDRIEPELYRYPAIDPPTMRAAVLSI